MKFLVLFSLIASTLNTSAQECTLETLLQKPGTWKATPEGSQGGTAAELASEKKTIAAIHTMLF